MYLVNDDDERTLSLMISQSDNRIQSNSNLLNCPSDACQIMKCGIIVKKKSQNVKTPLPNAEELLCKMMMRKKNKEICIYVCVCVCCVGEVF